MSAILRENASGVLEQEEVARADCYGLLANLFYAPPDADLLARLGQTREAETATPLSEAWNALRRAAHGTTADAVRREYDDLFIGVGRPAVMLYASYYMTGFLNDRPLAELRGLLAAWGLARRAVAFEPEDHFAALADVMRHLILDDQRTDAQREAVQREFFSRFLAPCYGPLCHHLEMAAEADFYRSLGNFARAFLDVERIFFGIEQQPS